MKRLLAILVVVIVGFAAGRLSNQQPVNAEGRGADDQSACSTDNPTRYSADADGNGQLEITDAIYLLSYLFLGGPEPLCVPPEVGHAGLPDTGQTLCYDEAGGAIPCDDVFCPGQDSIYRTGCPPEGRFIDNEDGTATDICTGLMWQQETPDVNEDGLSTEEDSILWCGALEYCDSLNLADHDDWRLPNIRELQSIVDYGRDDPATDPIFSIPFPFGIPVWYWSSTTKTDPGSRDKAWAVNFKPGGIGSHDKNESVGLFVRAVRDGP